MNKIIFLIMIFNTQNTFKLLAKKEDSYKKELEKQEIALNNIINLLEKNLEHIEQNKKEEDSRIFQIKNKEQFEADQNKLKEIKEKKELEIKKLIKERQELIKNREQITSETEIRDYNIRINKLTKQIKIVEDEEVKRIKLINSLYKNNTSYYEEIEKHIQNMITIVDTSINKINDYKKESENKDNIKMILKPKTIPRLKEIVHIIKKIEKSQEQIICYNKYSYSEILNQINQII